MYGYGIGIIFRILNKINIIFIDSLFLILGFIINIAMKLICDMLLKWLLYYIDF